MASGGVILSNSFSFYQKRIVMSSRMQEKNGGASIPHVLSVAGSDSGAGAGIQADLKACAARGVYCSTVITSVTAQNTVGVQAVHAVPEDFVAQQLKSVLSDMQVDVVKTGMLPSVGVVKVLLQSLTEFSVRALVVDPVMVSTSGDVLAGPSILSTFRQPTTASRGAPSHGQHSNPNIKEASALLGGIRLETVADMRNAAELLHALGPRYGILDSETKTLKKCACQRWWISLILWMLLISSLMSNTRKFLQVNTSMSCAHLAIKTRNTHGTGCTLASCIAAELAKGSSMLTAVRQVAKRYVETALDYSKDILIGNGIQGPFDHLLRLKSGSQSFHRKDAFNPSDLFLYAVTDSGMNKKVGTVHGSMLLQPALQGGATIVQLREKDAETREFFGNSKITLCSLSFHWSFRY
ncbi:thiamine biosynthetic bifunctional enzyme TH1 [Populus alba x Populus x berolinensis]|uniref:Thiamine biosynthetic bifunctional enzyme TH1 n=1 Tax=Populus alba x Populus x berolinensis TaxID=444605 RepID=A0AAD6R5E4_9ROSI|nr:thiamine biosynthetic bifunctional enzyme TH1 [Populus alba x Populus x berolinensis]